MSENRFKIHAIVYTTEPNTEADDWTVAVTEERESYPWGTPGVVAAVHDSHGLCYEVVHEDGVTRHYDHVELKPVAELLPQRDEG